MTANLQDRYDEIYALDGSTPSYLRVHGAAGTPSDGDVEIWNATDGRKEWGPMTGGSGGLSDGDYGDIVVSGTGTVMTIDTNVVTDGKLRQGAATSVIGRSANSLGNMADIAASADGQLLVRRSGALAFGALVAADIPSLAASIITSGTLPLARGGTDADLSASGGTTAVLAQDASHVITARNLVAVDIPNLDASKITAGQLTAARGGTGLDGSAAGNGKLLIGNGSGYALATLASADSSVSITNGAGTIDLAVTTVPVSGLPPWVKYSADTKPASAQAEDDEFDSSSLDAKWTETLGGAPTRNIDTTIRSSYMISISTTSQNAALSQSYAAGTALTSLAARIASGFTNSLTEIRIYLSDGTTGTVGSNAAWVGIDNLSGTVRAKIGTRDSGVTNTSGTVNLGKGITSFIIQIQREASNVWRASISTDEGRGWMGISTLTKSFSVAAIVAQLIGPAASQWNTERLSFDWIRRDWITL